METHQYGSRAWIESQYAASTDDPWGLTWRGSQIYRYGCMVVALQAQLQARMPAIAPALALIDVGCATGTFTAMLAKLNRAGAGSVLGTDISALAVARATARHPDLAFECVALDAASQCHAGSADVVTCMEVLYYLAPAERDQAMQQLRAMLKPGGLLLVSSMVARAPYFSAAELSTLVGRHMRIVGTGELYLKPLALWEKLMMKLRLPAVARARAGQVAVAARLGAVLPWLTRSHAYVIASND
jgi:2-polyprenyl-3-methyl-5-hydroxy-6-metoxy-1,4-benzoquinol methylase